MSNFKAKPCYFHSALAITKNKYMTEQERAMVKAGPFPQMFHVSRDVRVNESFSDSE